MSNNKPAPSAALEADYQDQLIDENAAAAFLDYSVRTLQNWRVRGGGPKFIRVSARSIRYRRRELIEWANANIRSSTSDSGQVQAGGRA